MLALPKGLGYFNCMSRKTDNIYKSIENLQRLKDQLEDYAYESKEIQDIEFQMGQELKNLKFWIDSLYLYNGKSTSNAKKASSRENGKKGGRPPKVVTELKKRKVELESVLIPDTETKRRATLDFLEERCLADQLEKYTKELEEIQTKLSNYKK